MARSNTFRPQSRTPRRQTSWTLGPLDNRTVSSTTAQLWTLAAGANTDGLTVIRIRGAALFALTTVSQAHGGFIGAIGIGICTLAAFTAGIGSVPTPITEEDWDGWMFHRYFQVTSNTASIADGVNAGSANLAIEIDTKAMRKLPNDMVIFGALEASDEFGVSTMTFDARTRMLVKLP